MPKKYYIHQPHHQRSRRQKVLIAVVTIFLVLALAAVVVRRVYYDSLQPVSNDSATVQVNIPKGAGVNQIASVLQQQHLIKSVWAFKLYIHNQDASSVLQAGTYQLRPSMSVYQLVSIISHGKVMTNLVTILPGQTVAEVRQTLLKAGYSTQEADAALNPANYSDVPVLVDKPATASLEGFLYPDSYQKDSSTSAQDLVRESLNEMQQHLTTGLRNAYGAQGLSAYQGLILASMVEKEAALPADQAQVAQVFLSRLHQNMTLGSDVTAFYGASLAGQKPSVTYDSPYNTLLHPGLPPTPISTVSQSALEAVASPANTNWLYFVAGDDGVVHFSTTLQQHNAQVQQYCHKLCS